MKIILTIVTLLFLASSANAGEAFDLLQGSWKSDSKGTIEELKKNPWWSPERLESVSALLGDLVVTYKGTKCYTRMDGWERIYTFRVVAEEARKIMLEWQDPDRGLQRSVIELFDDHYWITLNDNMIFRERYIRIKETDRAK